MTNRICSGRPALKDLNVLDETITYVLNAARKCTTDMQQSMPCTPEKVRLEVTFKHVKSLRHEK